MRFASILIDGQPALALVDGSGEAVRPLGGPRELGPETPLSLLLELADAAGQGLALDQVVFRPVVPNPRRVICLGLNYRAHAEEAQREVTDYPVLFTKWASSLLAPGATLVLPSESDEIDYEAEMAVVIGKPGRRIRRDDALDHVAGVTIANDVTVRDYQHKTHQWLPGKAWDASTPLGPWLTTLDETGDPGRLEISLELNGQQLQRSSTSLLIFDVPTIISTVSTFTCLEVGDVILTGTPGGVGARRDPPVFLHPGDHLAVSLERVGRLETTVAGPRP